MNMSEIMELVRPLRLDQAGHWRITAHRALCLGPPNAKHISGGSTLAAVVAALEAETQRPLIQANAQFLASAAVGEEFEIVIRSQQSGRAISQVMASVVAKGRDLAFVTATLGERPEIGPFHWAEMPIVKPLEQCPPIPFVRLDEGDLHSHLDMRLALDLRADPKGQACFWVKSDERALVGAAQLCLISDYLPESIHMNIGRKAGAVSLDNNIRIVQRMATPWLLCDIQLDAIRAGLFHGRMAIFAESGALLAVASQSGVVRLLDD
jgi:acyl-CoA thioesterase II